MQELYPLCDAAVSTSKIEGLPFNLLEAMACGLPILASNIKGHRDLVENKREFLFCTEQELCEKLVKYFIKPYDNINWVQILKRCSSHKVMPPIVKLYLQ
jgi:glycosyltransferase EpsD